jgi:hypothetical protein
MPGQQPGLTIDTKSGESEQISVSDKNLEGTVGKDLAQRIRKDVDLGRNEGEYSGLDLKIGGEWAKTKYDVMIPSSIKALTQGEVEKITLGRKDYNLFYGIRTAGKSAAIYSRPSGETIDFFSSKATLKENIKDAQEHLKTLSREQIQPGIRITPELKAKVMGDMPRAGGEAVGPLAPSGEEKSIDNVIKETQFGEGHYVPSGKEILKMVTDSFAGIAPSEDAPAEFLLGPSAAGKSSFATKLIYGTEIPIIDPDKYKVKFTGYVPEKANLYHEASSIANRTAIDKAIEEDLPFLNVITGRNTEKFKALISKLKSKYRPVI